MRIRKSTEEYDQYLSINMYQTYLLRILICLVFNLCFISTCFIFMIQFYLSFKLFYNCFNIFIVHLFAYLNIYSYKFWYIIYYCIYCISIKIQLSSLLQVINKSELCKDQDKMFLVEKEIGTKINFKAHSGLYRLICPSVLSPSVRMMHLCMYV